MRLTNWGPQSEMIALGGPWYRIRHYRSLSAMASAIIEIISLNITFFNSISVMTIITMGLSSLDGGKSVMKSTDISAQG